MSNQITAFPILDENFPFCSVLDFCPGDKSITQRALILSALSNGTTRIVNPLDSADCRHTAQALVDMGVNIEWPQSEDCIVSGVGLGGLKRPLKPLYLGNSGTGMRLLSGILVGQSFPSQLEGDNSLSKRPMQRIFDPLRLMGANISGEQGHAPIKILPSEKPLQAIVYELAIPSAQVKSAILLAGLYSHHKPKIIEPVPTRDHTERMLQYLGPTLQAPKQMKMPADISSAAFLLMAISMHPKGQLKVKEVGVNPTRIGFLEVLSAMGASVKMTNQKMYGYEPVADVEVIGPVLKNIRIDKAIPSLIDELPMLMVVATQAKGIFQLRGAAELRVKESDRIHVMATALMRLGIKVVEYPDGVDIYPGPLKSANVDSGGDHRCAMALLLAASVVEGAITVAPVEQVATSFPQFVSLAGSLGFIFEGEIPCQAYPSLL